VATSSRLGYEVAVSELTVRPYTEDLFAEVQSTFVHAFLRDLENSDPEWFRSDLEPERFSCAFDGAELVGTAAILTRQMTLPGADPTPVAAVTTVAVKPWHRRRGALTKLMHVQLHALHEQRDEPFAALWASEATIYGRFGYAVAGEYAEMTIPRGAPFRPGTDLGKDRVRELPRAQALPIITALYEKQVPQHVGWLYRSEHVWRWRLWDSEQARKGKSGFRFALHPDGYAIFRTDQQSSDVVVLEVVTTTPVGTAALWRYLLDLDHARSVVANVALDSPVVPMLQDPRQATRTISDSLWIRLVDVDRALVLRKYGTPLDTVFSVTDARCPWNEGQWRLAVDGSGTASVERTTTDPDFVLDVTALGAAFLGGVRLSDLAAAGQITELVPGTVARASRAFLGDHAPHCLEVF
jgi:predicted acetyltransferase